jgi:hypothetical protein
LVQRYLDNVVAAERGMVAKVFHVLRWTPRELERTIAGLLEAGTVRKAAGQLVSPVALARGG